MLKTMKTYKNIEYIVYFFEKIGSYCAYVRLPEKHLYQKFINKKRIVLGHKLNIGYDSMDINCHGGLTFTHKITKKNQENFPQGFSLGSWIGWDYSHCEDYCNFGVCEMEGKKWTEKEVEKECKNVIKQLLTIT